MKTYIQDYPSSEIPPSDICIIGTGAAGIELAHLLSQTHHSITLLEGGHESFDWQIQKLGDFERIGHPIREVDESQPLEAQKNTHITHLRQYGGTINIWGGRFRTLSPIDFIQKSYLKESGWPILTPEPHYLNLYKDHPRAL